MRSTTTFEKKAAPEFYDTCEEQSRVAAAPVDQTLRRLEIKRKHEEEAERRNRPRKNERDALAATVTAQANLIATRATPKSRRLTPNLLVEGGS